MKRFPTAPAPCVVSRPELLSINVNGLEVVVSSFDSVGVLAERFGHHCARFVHQGCVLLPAFTFAFYNIQSGDEVTVVSGPKKIPKYEKAKPKEETDLHKRVKERLESACGNNIRDREYMMERLRAAIDPTTALECARLTDIFRFRVETNAANYRKVCRNYAISSERRRNRPASDESFITVIPEKTSAPSTEFLPEI